MACLAAIEAAALDECQGEARHECEPQQALLPALHFVVGARYILAWPHGEDAHLAFLDGLHH